MKKKLTYEEMVDIIRANDLIKQWKVLPEPYRDESTAKKIVKLINTGASHEFIVDYITSIWHKVGIELSGLSKKEYFENPDIPLWERNDWNWSEDIEEWVYIE